MILVCIKIFCLVPCPIGKFGTPGLVGLRNVSECLDCPAGKRCLGDGSTNPNDCPAGNYCQNGLVTLCEAGYRCPAGSKAPQPCPYGTYQNSEGQSDCLTCPARRYCNISDNGGTLIGTINPIDCDSGHFCPAGSGFQIPCPPGTFSNSTRTLVCEICPAGYYCPDPGMTDVDDTYKCDPGFDCLGGAINKDQSDGVLGQICPLGYYCPDGRKIACESGSYGASTGLQDSTECSECPAGYDCTTSSAIENIADHKCEEGYFCPPGTGSTGVNRQSCITDGKYCPEGVDREIDCPAGKWISTSSIHKACTDCPRGEICTGSGKENCPDGYFCPGGNSRQTAVPCPAGTYSPRNGLYKESECKPCKLGKYCPTATTSLQVDRNDS